jgi:hypothetical protein
MMAKTADKWSLEKAYPPMLMVDYVPLRQKIVAEWLHCAGLTCDEYDLTHIAEMIEEVVLKELKCTAESPWHAVRELTQKEEE